MYLEDSKNTSYFLLLYLKVRSNENRIRLQKQKNISVSLLRKAKRKHYEDLSIADFTDNKKFWKRVKPLF